MLQIFILSVQVRPVFINKLLLILLFFYYLNFPLDLYLLVRHKFNYTVIIFIISLINYYFTIK